MSALTDRLEQLRQLRERHTPDSGKCPHHSLSKPPKPYADAGEGQGRVLAKPPKPGFGSFGSVPQAHVVDIGAPTFVEAETHLRRIARAAGLPWHRMRSDPDGIRNCDVADVVENWIDYTHDPRLLRAYIAAVAFRLALDPRCLTE